MAGSRKARVIEGTYRAFWQLLSLHVNWASEDAAFLQSNTDSNVRITYETLRNNGARSRNHCCSAKAISVTYSVCVFVFVAVGIQHAMRVRHIVVCGPPGSTIFFPHYLINAKIFEKPY